MYYNFGREMRELSNDLDVLLRKILKCWGCITYNFRFSQWHFHILEINFSNKNNQTKTMESYYK